MVGGALVWAAFAVRLARGLWFFGDDFDFLLNRSVTFVGDHSLLEPHNEHWSTIPILLFRLDFALFGLRHYLPYAAIPIAMHVLICALTVTLLRRAGSGSWVAVTTGFVAVFIAGGAGAENTLWDFQSGFLGSCLFGLLALVILVGEREGHRRAPLSVCALVVSLMSSGMGIVMVMWAAAFVLARDGMVRALRVVAVPAAVYLVWYATYGHGHAGAPPPDLAIAPIAAARGLGAIWSVATGVPGSGPVVLAAMAVAVALTRRDARIFALAMSGLVAVVAAYALLGYSRSGIGSDATLRSRYVYFGIVLTLPALAAGLTIVGHALARGGPYLPVVAFVTAAAVVTGGGLLQARRWTDDRLPLVEGNRDRVLAASRLVDSGLPILRAQPMPERNPDVTVAALQRSSVRAALPRVTPGPAAALFVSGHMLVDVGTVARPFAAPAEVRWRGFEPPARSQGSGLPPCETRSSPSGGALEVPPTATPLQLRVTTTSNRVRTQLVAGGRRSPAIRWPTSPGIPFYVASTAQHATLEVLVPPGRVTVCSS